MESLTKYKEFYKSHHIQAAELQKERRRELLEQQKQNRASCQDENRSIENFCTILQKKTSTVNHQARKTYKENHEYDHRLQESEWLRERPEDFQNWFIVPCPKGQRCMVIAANGRTEMYNKRGQYIQRFRSQLPGDRKSKNQMTILDCVYVETLKRFYVLDTIASCNQEMVNCDTEFRFFWMKTKLKEDYSVESEKLGLKDEGSYSFVSVDFFDAGNDEEILAFFAKYPQFDEDNPKLDGFLFYHKNSSYVFGQTPLVGWLFPFMIPEILGLPVNPKYMLEKPSDYVNSVDFMVKFDQELKMRKKRHFKKTDLRCKDSEMLELDDTEENCSMDDNTASILEAERKLETNGRNFNDI